MPKRTLTRGRLLAAAAPLAAAPLVGKLALEADAAPTAHDHSGQGSDRMPANHLEGSMGHAAMVGDEAPAVGGPNDLDDRLYPPPARPYRQGRVSEYQLDLDTREATLLWSWTEPGWYEPVIGDADYLPNGNVLVTRGHVWCYEFTPGHSALIELEPGTDRVVWRLDYDTQSNGIFRSERYDGCEIFSNAKYCPAVAARIAELRDL